MNRPGPGSPSRVPLMLLLLATWSAAPCRAEPHRLSSRVVTTKYGTLRGTVTSFAARHLQPVEVFLGVPYASAPVGSLRFMPPVTPPHWRGVRIADRFGQVCPQRLPDIRNETEALKRMPVGRLASLNRLLTFLNNQSEDCLHLNIYSPFAVAKEPSHRLPVAVFIHGESYEWNSGNAYDGSVLSSFGNIVVVTINYRLGVLGFLPAVDGSAKGNYGLMDQVAALHWIQENIGEFGGDPRNVTLWGHAHGAACVNILTLSPMAKRLFHRAILQSGSALSPWAIAREAPAYTRFIGKSLGCPLHDIVAMVECMRQRPIEDIMRVRLSVPYHLAAFGPTVDGIVLLNEPAALMSSYSSVFGHYDLLLGVTRLESYFNFAAQEDRLGIDEAKRDRLLRTLVRNLYSYHLQEIYLTVVNEYTDWARPVQHPLNVLDATADALGDALTVAPLTQAGRLHARTSAKSFFYVFGHQTEESDFASRVGCVHGEDLAYAFGAPLVPTLSHFTRNFTRPEMALSEAVMTYWTNFIKFGDPTPATSEPEPSGDRARGRFERITWPAYDPSHQRYLAIGIKPKVRDHYHAHRLSFWLDLIPKLHAVGSDTAMPQHHLLEDHDNHQLYDGVVRHLGPSSAPRQHPTLPPDGATATPDMTRGVPSWSSAAAASPTSPLTTALPTVDSTSVTSAANISDYMAVVMQHTGYSTALSVTVAVGCSLLILNILIFAGIYYQRDKEKLETKLQSRAYQSSSSSYDLSLDLPRKKGSSSASYSKRPPHESQVSSPFQEFSPPPPPLPPGLLKQSPGCGGVVAGCVSLGPASTGGGKILLTGGPESQPLLVHGLVRTATPHHMHHQQQQQQHQQQHQQQPCNHGEIGV